MHVCGQLLRVWGRVDVQLDLDATAIEQEG